MVAGGGSVRRDAGGCVTSCSRSLGVSSVSFVGCILALFAVAVTLGCGGDDPLAVVAAPIGEVPVSVLPVGSRHGNVNFSPYVVLDGCDGDAVPGGVVVGGSDAARGVGGPEVVGVSGPEVDVDFLLLRLLLF